MFGMIVMDLNNVMRVFEKINYNQGKNPKSN